MIEGVKICGVSNIETLDFISKHPYPPKFIGFITNYKKSKRYVKLDILKKLTSFKNKKINFVSVLVKPSDYILKKIQNLNFDYFQLYDVSPKRTKFIKKRYKKKIISALTIKNKKDVLKYKLYSKVSDIILFDGKGYEKSVGFNHKLINNIPKKIKIMIAGNIKTSNIPIINNLDYFIDLSGSLENKDGKKDLQKINNFLNTIKRYEIKKKNSFN
tara:strand:- start:278 stop:922 length:645 start_codon:yes stop_codon:yes gene_type:complete